MLYAEPDYAIRVGGCVGANPLDNPPDDPDFSELWGLENTGQTVNSIPVDPGTAGGGHPGGARLGHLYR